jgi:hypothetical protein
MLDLILTGYLQIVQVAKNRFQVSCRSINLPLEGSPRIHQSEWHPQEFEGAKRSRNGCLLYISWVHGYRVVSFS